jgi:hypothetical protein
MDNDFPRMLYRAGGVEQIHDGRFSTLIVADEQALNAALADGWFLTTPEAVAADEAVKQLAATAAAEKAAAEIATLKAAPPTRPEMEQKATELGVKFDGRTSDRKLLAMIEAALEA